jgi:hypothetical protein
MEASQHDLKHYIFCLFLATDGVTLMMDKKEQRGSSPPHPIVVLSSGERWNEPDEMMLKIPCLKG